MKKSIFNLFLSLGLIIGLSLTSCLGETKSTFEPENDLCYITTTDMGTKCAISSSTGYWMTSSYINNLNTNSYYYLKYHCELSQGQDSQGLYVATNVGPGTSGANPLPENNKFTQTDKLVNYPQSVQVEGVNPSITAISPNFYTPYKTFNDKWIFYFTAQTYAEDWEYKYYDGGRIYRNNIVVNVVLQQDNQGSLNENQAILNVYLTRHDPNLSVDTTADLKTSGGYAVVDLSQLRTYFQNNMTGLSTTSAKAAYFQFQYYKYNTSTKKYEASVTKDGALPSSDENVGSGNYYGLYITSSN